MFTAISMAICLLVVFVYVVYKTRQINVSGSDGYFLAGRSLTGGVICATILLTNLSTCLLYTSGSCGSFLGGRKQDQKQRDRLIFRVTFLEYLEAQTKSMGHRWDAHSFLEPVSYTHLPAPYRSGPEWRWRY